MSQQPITPEMRAASDIIQTNLGRESILYYAIKSLDNERKNLNRPRLNHTRRIYEKAVSEGLLLQRRNNLLYRLTSFLSLLHTKVIRRLSRRGGHTDA